MDIDKELLDIFNDPMFSDVQPSEIKLSPDDRLIQSFEEINKFYERNHRLPEASKGRIEKGLRTRLHGILCEEDKVQYLLPYDRFALLRPKDPTETDLEEILNNPILDTPDDAASILRVPAHLRKNPQIDDSEYIAQRRRCEDFHLYQEGFIQVHRELNSGQRSFVKFSSSQLENAGSYFVLDGVILFVAEVLDQTRSRKGHLTGRCICIFENGTMSDLKLDTLRRALYENGYAIRENNETVSKFLSSKFQVENKDQLTGYIYVLKSLSANPAISSVENLYKIGFSTTTVQDRIAHAELEPTYLNDKVEIVATWQAYNLSVAKFETLIHQLFNEVRFQVKVGEHTPSEWFVVPYPVIKKAINCMIKGIPVSYDPLAQAIIEHTSAVSQDNEIIDISGWKVLTLNIKEVYFKEIVAGRKKEEYRRVKPSTMNKYTFIEDGKRWLRRYDAIRFFVGYHKDRESALVEISNTTYEPDERLVTYHLGRVISTSS